MASVILSCVTYDVRIDCVRVHLYTNVCVYICICMYVCISVRVCLCVVCMSLCLCYVCLSLSMCIYMCDEGMWCVSLYVYV